MDGDATDETQCWLVAREYDTKGLVTLTYATPNGHRRKRLQWAAASLARRTVTAGRSIDPNDLEDVTEDDLRERYRTEAARMRERHDPDDEV